MPYYYKIILTSFQSCSKMWFGLICTIHYFIIFCMIVKQVQPIVESSFWQDSDSGFKKLGLWLQLQPWARIQTLGLWLLTPDRYQCNGRRVPYMRGKTHRRNQKSVTILDWLMFLQSVSCCNNSYGRHSGGFCGGWSNREIHRRHRSAGSERTGTCSRLLNLMAG